MRILGQVAFAIVASTALSAADARDDRLKFPIKSALEKGQSTSQKIDPAIRLYFGGGTVVTLKK